MLEDLRALVEFAHAGSIAGAADRLRHERTQRKRGQHERAGFVEVEPFNNEPYAHHWFQKDLRHKCVAALDYLPWVSCVASISAIMSISTQAPNGTCATLTALREWMPRSPNTWTRSSDAPSAIR
jgi:hypothetical protein